MENKMKKVLIATSLLLASVSGHAVESIHWDELTLAYNSADFDGPDMHGFSVTASKLLGENVFIEGSYAQDSIDLTASDYDIDFDTYSLGLGYRHAISKQTDFYGKLSVSRVSFDYMSSSDSDTGYELELGIRSLATDSLELGANIGYQHINSDSDGYISGYARYHFKEDFALSLGHTISDGDSITSIAAVIAF